VTLERAGAFVASILVGSGLIGGFLLAGSPRHSRDVMLDSRRVEDMRVVADAITRRYTHNGHYRSALPERLPPDLHATRPDGSDATRDPGTGLPYRYVHEKGRTYRLCADFATADDERDHWAASPHPAGRACYRYDFVYTPTFGAEHEPVPDR
jgi:hypothetical protein